MVVAPLFPHPLLWATISLLPVSVGLPILDILYKWNHIIYAFCDCFLSFGIIFWVLSVIIPFMANNISLYLLLLFNHCHVQLFATPWTVACQFPLSFTNSRNLLKFMSIELVIPSIHLILSGSLPLLPAISIRVFSSESVLHISWPKYLSFSLSISPSNEYSGLISFRIYSFDLLAVQGTLKSLLQHGSSKASIL